MEADKRVSLLKIAEEFHSLLVPLSTDQRVQLEENIRMEGCRDPLVVWQRDSPLRVAPLCQDDILIDGHNRYEICQAHGIDFTVIRVELPDREAVVNWIINNQLGRRNLTAEQASYLRGKRYNLEKESHGGDRKSNPQNGDLKTNERLAQEFKVGKTTIERDGKYAQAVDKIESTFGEPIKQGILNREVLATKQDVQTLGELADEVREADNDMPPLLRKAEKMQELLDELPDDVQKYILDNNENEFTLLQDAVRIGHKREKLREKVEAYPRSDREIEFEKQAALVWESIDDKGLPPLEKFKFKGMRHCAF